MKIIKKKWGWCGFVPWKIETKGRKFFEDADCKSKYAWLWMWWAFFWVDA